MADEELSFLDEAPEGVGDAPEPEQEAVEAAPEPEPAQEPTGEAAPEPQAEPPSAEEEKPQQQVSLTALLDEREKRQNAERERQELLSRLQQFEQQSQAQQQKAPDFFENPEQRVAMEVQKATQIARSQMLDQSQFFATQQHGAELTQKAAEFVMGNPQLAQQLRGHPSPWHGAVELFQKHQVLEEIGDDPAAYRERIKEEIKAELLKNTQQPAPQAPPPSMSQAPAAGGGDAISPGNTFDEIFPT
jgi:hypothetical protein